VSYRIAVGPQQGRKAFMIRTIRPLESPDPGLERVAKANGFSLHAGVSCQEHQKNKRKRSGGVPLCLYIARPAVAVPRLSLSSTGKVLYILKTPYRDGTTQGQSHPLPRYPCPKSPLARGGHSGQMWQGTYDGRKCASKDPCRVPCCQNLPLFSLGRARGSRVREYLKFSYQNQ
jgi:hypothetical protein